MKTKVKIEGFTVIEVGAHIYMCGVATDGRFVHSYVPEGKKRQVMCVHETAEACHAHDQVLGTYGSDKVPPKDVQRLIDGVAKTTPSNTVIS